MHAALQDSLSQWGRCAVDTGPPTEALGGKQVGGGQRKAAPFDVPPPTHIHIHTHTQLPSQLRVLALLSCT